MSDTTATTEPRELLELDVGEVSMVDAPAIRRKFVMVKQASPTPTAPPVIPANTPAPVASVATGESVDEDEVIAADSDIAKALFPMLTALASEKMAALVEKVSAIQTALTSGTLTKKDAREMFSGLSTLLWGVEDDVIAISKSAGTPVDLDVVQKAKRMTARRIGELKSAQEQITSLLDELEDEVMADKTDTTKTEGAPAATADITKAITDAVQAGLTAGLEPVNKSITDVGTRLDTIEARVAKVEEGTASTTTEPAKKAEAPATEESDVAKAIKSALAPMAKSLEGITQRLDTIESTPAAGGDDDTTTTTTDDVTKAGSSDFWAGAGVSPRS